MLSPARFVFILAVAALALLTVQPAAAPRSETLDQILLLARENYSRKEIASRLSKSRSTVYRRLRALGRHSKWSTLSDAELLAVVGHIKRKDGLARAGRRYVQGALRALGFIVQRDRVQAALHAVDPEGTAQRARRALKRRVYSVPGPMSLWHIDGLHKLIRFGQFGLRGLTKCSQVPHRGAWRGGWL